FLFRIRYDYLRCCGCLVSLASQVSKRASRMKRVAYLPVGFQIRQTLQTAKESFVLHFLHDQIMCPTFHEFIDDLQTLRELGDFVFTSGIPLVGDEIDRPSKRG